ncbi:MAG: HD domain-containing protein [Treponema sp.]|nr:HD domain-containing protein [Treponema sp.]
MDKEKRSNFIFFIVLFVFFILIILSFSLHVLNVKKFNSLERVVFEGQNSECSIDIYPRAGVADSWDKTDVEFNDDIVTFTGTTYDCSVKNYTDSVISDWKLRINIKRECFINNSWCGTVEIHQKSKTTGKMVVQELDLRDYKDEDILLDHFYVSQDLYIPLNYGDYIVYNPSVISGEMPIRAFKNEVGKVVIGFIFYHYKGQRLIFSCSMNYKFLRSYFQGLKPKLLICAFIFWIMIVIVRVTFILTFRNLKKESNSVIHAVSRIYNNLYQANLENNTFQEIRATDTLHKFFERYSSAREALKDVPKTFYKPESQKEVSDFYNVDLWKKRLKDVDSCSADFETLDINGKGSAKWLRTNLIVCRRNSKNEPVEVICGLMDVDAEVREREQNKLMMERFATDLSNEVAEQTLHIQEIQRRIVSGLGDMIGSRDGNTGGHVKRTSEVIKFIVEEILRRNARGVSNTKFLAITEKLGEDIIRAAPMHDLGKIFIDTSILCKPGKLTAEEYSVMKTHSVHSGEIVNLILRDVEEEPFVNVAFNIARYHHERWDGKGYPEGEAGGKIGEGIPIEARIMAVADVYDALVSKRCYKDAMSFEMAYKIMLEGMGSQFDPDMEEIFKACRDDLESYYSNDA